MQHWQLVDDFIYWCILNNAYLRMYHQLCKEKWVFYHFVIYKWVGGGGIWRLHSPCKIVSKFSWLYLQNNLAKDNLIMCFLSSVWWWSRRESSNLKRPFSAVPGCATGLWRETGRHCSNVITVSSISVLYRLEFESHSWKKKKGFPCTCTCMYTIHVFPAQMFLAFPWIITILTSFLWKKYYIIKQLPSEDSPDLP